MAIIQYPQIKVRKPAIEHPQTVIFSFKYFIHFTCTATVIAKSVFNNKYKNSIRTILVTLAIEQQWFVKLLHALIRNLFSAGDCL